MHLRTLFNAQACVYLEGILEIFGESFGVCEEDPGMDCSFDLSRSLLRDRRFSEFGILMDATPSLVVGFRSFLVVEDTRY